jgi:hypothetical protein
MTKRNLILIGLFVIAALFNSEMDTIRYAPSKAWFDGWWIASNWQQSWLQKYIFGFTVDGWHLCKMIMLSSFMAMFIYALNLKWYWWLMIMISWGLLFNIFYSL